VPDEHDTEIFVSKRSNTGVARDTHYYMSHGFGVDWLILLFLFDSLFDKRILHTVHTFYKLDRDNTK
jgi:hypothetical protein